jgi:predicted ATPase
VSFQSPVTFFQGENGSGKTTLLEAMAYKCGIHIWRRTGGIRLKFNPYEKELYRFISVEWSDGAVPGSFFSSQFFNDFSQNLEEWAVADPEMLKYFGGKSLITQSHGESLLTYFRARYRIKGLYFMDEPETALSPRSQLELLKLLNDLRRAGHAQFIIATHSPILLACPGATIYTFDEPPLKAIAYEETENFKVYKNFMMDPSQYL